MSTTEPVTFTLPTGPAVLICHGDGQADLFFDDAQHAQSMTPIRRAATIARLRALADVIASDLPDPTYPKGKTS